MQMPNKRTVDLVRYAVLVAIGTCPALALAADAASSDALGEVVVTATRQNSTVNRVPISISAVTSEAIEKQGIKDVQDLARSVPSLNFRRGGGEGNPSVSIRGLASTLGSPTVGVYLDDVPIQKRDTNGAVTGNGSPFPMLYDLARVEVLRGPQGTLYGGSAQGGAIRFITPTASLTTVTATARSEVSMLSGGDPGYELGLAAGGPLIDNKLGLRVSVFSRRQGGYLDHVSLYTGQEFAQNSNWRSGYAGRASLLWQASDQLQVTPAVYYSVEQFNNSDIYYRNIPAITYAPGIFTNRGTTASGVPYDFPDTVFAGGTFGPYNYFGKYKTFQGFYPDTTGKPSLVTSPRRSENIVPSLTLDYELGSVATLKSISSYIADATAGYTAGTGLGHRAQVLPTTTNTQFVRAGSVATTCGSTSSVTQDGVCRIPVTGGIGPTSLFIPGFPQRYAQLNYSFARRAITQELRLQSAPDSGRLSWLGGLFFTDVTYRQRLVEPGNEEQSSIFLRGVGEEWFMGTVNVAPDGTPLAVGQSGNHSFRDQTTKERETAAFGEATFSLTEALKLTGGLRYSRMEVSYLQYTSGSVFGNTNFGSFIGSPLAPTRITTPTAGHPFANQPGDPYYNVVSGKQSETPVSPKLGLAWQATPGDLFYATYSTGYRPGGVNQPAPPGNCAPALAALGITTTPLDFKSDTVRSYEVGAKNRLGPWQVNTSAFYIKWINPQISQRITQCGHTYIDNAGAAVSKGMDVQIAGRLGPVTLTGAAAYTDAKYTETVLLKTPPGAAAQIVARDGDTLGAPKWQFNASAQYDFLLADHPSYVRADYQYSGNYFRTTGPGTVSYQAVTYNGESGRNFNARLGMNFARLEASVWASNLTNEDTVTSVGNTAPSALVTETAVRPREIGVTLSYRY